MMGELIRSKKATSPCYSLNYVLIGFSPYLKVSLNLSKWSLERKKWYQCIIYYIRNEGYSIFKTIVHATLSVIL